MSALRAAGLIALKDLRLEFRSPGRLAAMSAFAVMACFLFSFALGGRVAGRDVAAGLLWLAILFAATAGAGRIYDCEEEDGAFRHLLLAPIPRAAVFWGKCAANVVLTWAVAILTFAALVLFMGVRETGSVALHAAVLLPGTLGLAATGTFFGLVPRHSSLGDSLLPVLTFPLLVPVVYLGASASARVFAGRPWDEISGSARLLWAFALGFAAVASALFRHLTEE